MHAPLLRKIEPHEFPAYRTYFVEDYAQEITSNYNRPLQASRAQAAAELEESFPQGIAASGNHLMCIELPQAEGAVLVGYLWYSAHAGHKEAFIQDFCVFEQYRGKGYGKASMTCLETELHNTGVEQIKLRVAQTNHRALHLYQELGFDITGINMAKTLTGL